VKKEDSTSFGSMSRRKFCATVLAGAAISVIGFGLDRTILRSSNEVIRPPGAVEEEAFLSLCSRCGRCIVVCPNSALHLQGFENGLAHFLTPRLIPNIGSCILPVDGCQNCIDACPTKALCKIDISDIPSKELSNLIKIGTAVLDTTKCIPYELEQSCLACIEVCPVDEAITWKSDEEPRKPVFNEDICFGCGACENACPTIPKAVKVTSAGAKRVNCW
jgi:ferredoxin